jgi:hypothetical protein
MCPRGPEAWVSSGDDIKDRDDVLRREANYFDPSADAVAYAAYREQGFRSESARSRAPIGASSSNVSSNV